MLPCDAHAMDMDPADFIAFVALIAFNRVRPPSRSLSGHSFGYFPPAPHPSAFLTTCSFSLCCHPVGFTVSNHFDGLHQMIGAP